MLARLTPFLGASLVLFTSCGEQGDESQKGRAEAKGSGPAVTKLHRPAATAGKAASRKAFRAQLDSALARSSPEQRDQALSDTAWACFELEPELAREAFDKLTPGSEQKNRLIQHFAMRLAAENLEEAHRWAGALETDEERSLAYARIALVIASSQPERAAQLLSDSGVAGRDLDVAVVQVVQQWATKSPTDAAAWIALFDPGEARSAGLKTLAASWGKSDAQAAFAWIAGIPEGPLRNEAERGMAEAILDQPESGRQEWLSQASPEIRTHFHEFQAQAQAEAEAEDGDEP
jgi:hypothetical protein